MILIFVIVLFLGGIAAMLANYQAGMRSGEIAGLISAIAAIIGVEYIVRVGLGRLAR